jgi:hypothetical protein
MRLVVVVWFRRLDVIKQSVVRVVGDTWHADETRRELIPKAVGSCSRRGNPLVSWIGFILRGDDSRQVASIFSRTFFQRRRLRFRFPRPETAAACPCTVSLTTAFQ